MIIQHKLPATRRSTAFLAFMICIVLIGCLISLQTSSTADAATPTPTSVPTRGLPAATLHVKGNQLLDGNNQPFLLRGAQIESSFNNVGVRETADSVLYQATNHLTSDTFQIMHSQWNMNAVRLPLSVWIWQQDPADYLDCVATVVQQANDAQLVVILALQDDKQSGSTLPKSDIKMPTAASVDFWKAAAAKFADNPNVIFDLYNEPNLHGTDGDTKAPSKKNLVYTDAEWDFWAKGGTQNGQSYVGMQDLLDAIRSSGAQQVVAAAGMGGTLFRNPARHALKDSNVIYTVHIYFGSNNHTAEQWDQNFGFLSRTYPVYVGEWAFMPNADYVEQCRSVSYDTPPAKVKEFMKYMDDRKLSWTAWAFILNRLILDYAAYTPTRLDVAWICGDKKSTAGMGTLVQQYLTGSG